MAGGAYPSPVPHADVVTFTTHKALRGPRGAMIVCKEEHAKAIDKAVFPMMQGGPLEHCIAAKAVALKEAMTPEFRDYAHRVVRDARALAAGLADEGLRVISGGTDSHLILADVRPVGIDGKAAEAVCDEVGIALNKNQIPYDPNPPSAPSGIRVGTPGPATLGMDEAEMAEIASIIGEVLKNPEDAGAKEKSGQRVRGSDGAVPALRVDGAAGGCRTATAAADCGHRGRLPDRLPRRSGHHVRADAARPAPRGPVRGDRSAVGAEASRGPHADDGRARDVGRLPRRDGGVAVPAVLRSDERRPRAEPLAAVVTCTLMVGLGVIDDRRGTSALAKLTAQIFIAGILVLLGVQLAYFVLPGEGLAVLGTDEAVPLTILWVVAAANAINLVDGLDGLAAGMVAIAASHVLHLHGPRRRHLGLRLGRRAPLRDHRRGSALGFLPWNFHPAKIFMGDTGSMLLGMLVAIATISGVGSNPVPPETRGTSR